MAAPMPLTWTRRTAGRAVVAIVAVLSATVAGPSAETAAAQPAAARLTLRQLVTPSARVETQGRLIRFALHGLIYFDTLDALFRHIDDEAGRWTFPSAAARQAFAAGLLRRGVESRVVSMETELPLELLLTHTRADVDAAITAVTGGAAVFTGRHWQLPAAVYRGAFVAVRDRWSRSLNCWSASPSLPGRVLSNWYVIDEGITLYGASYDSTEHFWQAVKFHPDVTVGEVRTLLESMRTVEWRPWIDSLAADQAFYFANAYAVEFLKRNLHRERLTWYHDEFGSRRASHASPNRPAARHRRARCPVGVHAAAREDSLGRSRRCVPPGRGVRRSARPAGARRGDGRARCAHRASVRRDSSGRLWGRPHAFSLSRVPGADAGDLEGEVPADAALRRRAPLDRRRPPRSLPQRRRLAGHPDSGLRRLLEPHSRSGHGDAQVSTQTFRQWVAAAACAAALVTTPPVAGAQEFAIVDADMGVLNDDAVALFMLLNSPNVTVLGVTIVPGNTWMESGTAFALRQLELVGRQDVPVFMGVREPLMGSRQSWLEAEERLWGKSEYLGAYGRPRPESYLALDREPAIGYPTSKPSPEHAVDFIVRAVKAHPNQVTLFVLGPATNLALAIRKNPEIVPLVKSVYYMGGAIDVPGNTTPAAEFNWWFDPESVRIALRAPFREQVIVPNDIAEKVYYTKAEYDRVAAAPETPITALFKQLHGPRFAQDAGGAVVRLGRADHCDLPAAGDRHDARRAIRGHRRHLRSELRPLDRLPPVAAPFARLAGRLPGRHPEGEGAHGRRPHGVLEPLRRSR